MADVIKKSTNKFTKGLVMDFSPENTRNEVLTHALNATLLTFNGNELSLQNDMGNARVETAYLPEGYIPVGTCEYGGIIYIVSYNPLEDKSQIGCFPSPERNVSNDELGSAKISPLTWKSFQDAINDTPSGTIHHNAEYILLKENSLNPGDKFLINANPDIYEELLLDLTKNDAPIANPMLALNIVSIEDSGKIIYLNSAIRQYEKKIDEDGQTSVFNYHILGEQANTNTGKVDLDSYRNVISSGYNVFRSKTSGRLAILAELVMIDSYSVTHSVKPSKDSEGNVIPGSFDVLLHTEVTPTLNTNNFTTAPKLAYYHLKESQGYLSHAPQAGSGVVQTPLFSENCLNSDFLEVPLTEIYSPSSNINLNGLVSDTGKFRFPYANTYHGKMLDYVEGISEIYEYTLITAGNYHRINQSQVIDNLSYFSALDIDFYKYDPTDGQYTPVDKSEALLDDREYFVNEEVEHYEDVKRNVQYYGQILYEQVHNPYPVSDKTLLENSDIQKYKQETSFIYTAIAFSDIKSHMTIVIKDVEQSNKWTVVSNPSDPSLEYYQQTTVVVYIPITQEEAFRLYSGGDSVYYYPDKPQYQMVPNEVLEEEYWPQGANDKYPYDETSVTWGYPKILYRYWKTPNYIPATEEDLQNYYKPDARPLYYKSNYSKVDLPYQGTHQVFMVPYRDTYLEYDKFKANATDNYIKGYNRPSSSYAYHLDGTQYDTPMSLHILADLIPQWDVPSNVMTQYEDLKLGTLKLPNVAADNDLDLPFKYSYTVVPCMNYGKLDHLAVSNTIDFSQLHAFNHSQFNTWKYHIDGSQLKLTFGAEIFDTFEDNKVDGLILEFYDLWGFAGSLEVNDKKSYSGSFTKILSLNSPGALSRKLVKGNEYQEGYRHNISLEQKDNRYYLNGEEVTWSPDLGWGIREAENDCGVLYPNLIYGVKTYLRQTTSDGFKFTRKKDFFLYTLPILNDFYYTVNDFSTIENPTVDLMLTYKLMDSSNKAVYNSAKIEKGYDAEDLTPVSDYLKGQYKESSLSGTKYYSYIGASKLYLEIGLKQEYQQYGLSYSPEINDFFSCTLQLVSDDAPDRTFTVRSGDTASTNVLNYKESTELTVDSNQITFGELGNGTVKEIAIPAGSFRRYNFINSSNISTIPIKYRWIVGYPFSVSDIRTTDISTTTMCALLHKDASGKYNLEDFSIYNASEDATNPLYLSSAMYVNGRYATEECFGIAKQVGTSGNVTNQYAEEQYHIQSSKCWPVNETRKLNTGEPLKKAVSFIGKLTFVQAHAHNAGNYDYGVNIRHDSTDYGIVPGTMYGACVNGNDNYPNNDDTAGSIPYRVYYNDPLYNLAVNTKKSINTYEEFVSTIDYKTTTGIIQGYDRNNDGKTTKPYSIVWKDWYNQNMRAFVGFTGEQLSTFNKKLLNTVKSIYAYNLDMDMMQIQMGNVSVTDNPVSFVSHLISKDASITLPPGKVFSDYLYVGAVSLSSYFTYLTTHSSSADAEGIKTVERKNGELIPIASINFQPSYTYLGQEGSAYLITSLTYNTSAPLEMQSQLEIKTSNCSCIKHEDGSYDFIEGIPNQNLLYGFDRDHQKLVQLDVANYVINDEGSLTIRKDLNKEEFNVLIPITSENFNQLIGNSYTFNQELSSSFGSSVCEGSVKLSKASTLMLDYKDPQKGAFYYLTNGNSSTTFIQVDLEFGSDLFGHKYNVQLNSDNLAKECEVLSYALNLDIQDGNSLPVEVISQIMTGDDRDHVQFEYTNSTGLLASYKGLIGQLRYTVPPSSIRATELSVSYNSLHSKSPILTEVIIKNIPLKITRTLDYTVSASSIVYVPVTNNYSDVQNHRYILTSRDYNQARLRGTSIVINDLYFDPLSTGHRLYMRSDRYMYDNDALRAKIYYRSLNSKETWSFHERDDDGVKRSSKDYRTYNNLSLHTGPCATVDNLYKADYD